MNLLVKSKSFNKGWFVGLANSYTDRGENNPAARMGLSSLSAITLAPGPSLRKSGLN